MWDLADEAIGGGVEQRVGGQIDPNKKDSAVTKSGQDTSTERALQIKSRSSSPDVSIHHGAMFRNI